MGFDTLIATLRESWTTRLVDTCDVTADDTGTGTLNPITLVYESAPADTVVALSVACLIRPDTDPRVIEVAGQNAFDSKYVVLLPWDSNAVQPDMIITPTVCTFDPDLVGVKLKVDAPILDSYNTRRAVRCSLYHGTGVGP